MNNIDQTPVQPLEIVPHTALVFLCPACECALRYEGSRAPTEAAADADETALSDYYRCPAGCGVFEHDRGTHRMRQIE